jgi:hypothetical protein
MLGGSPDARTANLALEQWPLAQVLMFPAWGVDGLLESPGSGLGSRLVGSTVSRRRVAEGPSEGNAGLCVGSGFSKPDGSAPSSPAGTDFPGGAAGGRTLPGEGGVGAFGGVSDPGDCPVPGGVVAVAGASFVAGWAVPAGCPVAPDRPGCRRSAMTPDTTRCAGAGSRSFAAATPDRPASTQPVTSPPAISRRRFS